MSVDPDYADIICIGIKEIGKEPKLYLEGGNNKNKIRKIYI